MIKMYAWELEGNWSTIKVRIVSAHGPQVLRGMLCDVILGYSIYGCVVTNHVS